MDDTASLLPPVYRQAAATLQKLFSARPLAADAQGNQQLLDNAEVKIGKGFSVQNWKPDASRDILQITVKSPLLISSDGADAVGKMVFNALNEIEAVRNETILVSNKDYLAQGKEQLAELQRAAKEAGIPGSEIDYTKAAIFNPNVSRNQQQKYGVQVVENDSVTQLRVNIPTNPENRDAASALAKRVVDDLTRRLPEIKAQMIARIKRKNYIPGMTPEMERQLQNHELKVISQQQGNWTSVFLDIRSPQQLEAQRNPGHIADPAALKKTNMLSQVTDDKSRFKLASRAVMFEGGELARAASYFMEVAGSEDIKNGLGKMMHYLTRAKPEYAEKADALMAENFLKSPEQWNLPPEQQERFKEVVSARIDPDHPDVLKFELRMAKGKADEVVKKIAGLEQTQSMFQSKPDPALESIASAIVNAGQALEGWTSMLARQKEAKEQQKNSGISAA